MGRKGTSLLTQVQPRAVGGGPVKEVVMAYKPNPKQAEFHRLAAKYRSFVGGWGNGKTSGGCAEFFMRLMEFPGTNSIVARKTRPELKSTTWEMLMHGDQQETAWKGIPKEAIKVYNRSELYIELRNGSKIWGIPLDDPKKIENFNLGLFMIDQAEEVEEDIFLKFHGRLRQVHSPREGILLWNPNGHWWGWRRFIDPSRSEKWKKTYRAVEATPFDNPNLPEDYFEQFEGLPEHWYARFVMGSHDVFTGQIFVDYNPDLHVIQPFRIPQEWERWCCIDPGIRHEGCVSWVARSPGGDAFYYREVLEPNQTIEWWSATIFEKEAMNDWGGPEEEITRRFIGPEARIRSQTDGRSVLDLYHENGIYPEISDRDPSARISRITEYLRCKPGHLHPFGDVVTTQQATPSGEVREVPGAPRLYVFADCHKLQEYLPQYRWRPQRTNFTEEDAPETPRKKDDHNIDCLGHILVAFDDLPEVANTRAASTRTREQEFIEEHFERELTRASAAAALRGYRPGRVRSAV